MGPISVIWKSAMANMELASIVEKDAVGFNHFCA
jgi:hypothetical protein